MIYSENPSKPEYLVEAESVGSAFRENGSPSKRFSLPSLLRLCLRDRWVLLAVVLTTLLLTTLYLLVRTPIYASTVALMPADNTSSASSLIGLLSSTPGSAAVSASGLLPSIKTTGSLFVGVLQSRTAQESLVDRFHLLEHYRLRLTEDACKQLSLSTKAAENPKNGIVTITVEDRDPQLASQLAGAYVDELDRIITQNSTSAAHRERTFLEGRLKDIKEDLDRSAKALSSFASKNRTVDIVSQSKATMEADLRLQSELASARSDLAGLRETYSDDNGRVQVAQARIRELEQEIAKISGNPAKDPPQADSSSFPSISQLPALGVTYADLQRRVTVDESLWGALTKQYETAKVQEAKEIPSVRLLDAPAVPQRKSNASKISVLALGLLVGVFLGVLSVVGLGYWRALEDHNEAKLLLREILGTLWAR